MIIIIKIIIKTITIIIIIIITIIIMIIIRMIGFSIYHTHIRNISVKKQLPRTMISTDTLNEWKFPQSNTKLKSQVKVKKSQVKENELNTFIRIV